MIRHNQERRLADSLTLGFVGQKVVNLGGRSVVGTDLEALVGHVEDHWEASGSATGDSAPICRGVCDLIPTVLTHDGQTDQTDVCAARRTCR